MNFELQILDKIKSKRVDLEKLQIDKMNAPTIAREREILLNMEKTQAFIDGLQWCVDIICKSKKENPNTNFEK